MGLVKQFKEVTSTVLGRAGPAYWVGPVPSVALLPFSQRSLSIHIYIYICGCVCIYLFPYVSLFWAASRPFFLCCALSRPCSLVSPLSGWYAILLLIRSNQCLICSFLPTDLPGPLEGNYLNNRSSEFRLL